MAICPKCGSRSAKYVLRSAGTRSRSRNYRTGIQHSVLLSTGGKKYYSSRQHKTVGYCQNCGFTWDHIENQSSISPRFLLTAILYIFYFCVFYVLFVRIGFAISKDIASYIKDQLPGWFFLFVACVAGLAVWGTKKAIRTVFQFLCDLPRIIYGMVSNTRKPKTHSVIEPNTVISDRYATKPITEPSTHSVNAPLYPLSIEPVFNDVLFCDAVDIAVEAGTASVSLLQRKLKLGYARTARIIDEMEEKGIVGPFMGSTPRHLLITKAQWDQFKRDNGIASHEKRDV